MKQLYPEKLEEIIFNNPTHIPYIVSPETKRLKLYRKYFSVERNTLFKVWQIYEVGKELYYSIKYPDHLFGEITYPKGKLYELFSDSNNIRNTKTIINTKISYTGAEIRYWFFINNKLGKKYKGFIPFINPNSKSCIMDNKYYFVYSKYDEKTNKYYNIIIIQDKERK